MKTTIIVLFFCCLISACTTTSIHKNDIDKNSIDKAAIIQTNKNIRAAFTSGNIEEIVRYHHADVEKAFSWNDYQVGSNSVKLGLAGILENYQLEFLGSAEDMESLQIFSDSAVMIARFALKGTPKKASVKPFLFSGRTMIVYVRSKDSPTGWLSFREMITPEK
ncbi:MAG TPA: hypothetical protein VIZ65_18035 [Cellvibrionaceae bacterium]